MRPDQEEFFTVLYREYFNQIKLYAMAHISDPHRAEEIAQDTFHTAVEKIDTLMKADEPIRWLKRTAKNKIRNEQRTRQRAHRKQEKYICPLRSAEHRSSGGTSVCRY